MQDCDVHLATFKLGTKEKLAWKIMMMKMGLSLLLLFVLSETSTTKRVSKWISICKKIPEISESSHGRTEGKKKMQRDITYLNENSYSTLNVS